MVTSALKEPRSLLTRMGWAAGGTRLPAPAFKMNLLDSAMLDAGEGTQSFTRATQKHHQNHESQLKLVESGEIVFDGCRRVHNLVTTTSEDMEDASFVVANNAVVSSPTTVTFDGTAAGQISHSITITDEGQGAESRQFVFSVKIRVVSGPPTSDGQCQLLFQGDAVTSVTTAIGDAVAAAGGATQRYSCLAQTDAAGTTLTVRVRRSEASVLEITEWQVEEVTGQANQTAGDYVSVGVESSPLYHGAMVDGVKYFQRLNGNTLASTAILTDTVGAKIVDAGKFAEFDGVSGSYLSTGDIAWGTDLDMRFHVRPDSWSTNQCIASQWVTSGNQRAFYFNITSAGKARLAVTDLGSDVGTNADSTVAFGYLDGTAHHVRFTWSKSGAVANFYTSEDGITWTQLGAADVALDESGGIFNSTADIELGSRVGGTTDLFTGRIYNAEFYDGIGGSLLAEMDADDWTTGGTFTSGATSETWTINGNSWIFGPNSDARWDTRVWGYHQEAQVQNELIWSEDFTKGAWTQIQQAAAPTADQVRAPDGRLVADLLEDDGSTGTGQVGLQQVLTVTSGVAETWSCYAKANGVTWAALQVTGFDGVASGTTYFNLSAATIGTAYAGHTARIERLPSGWCRLQITFTSTTDVDGGIRIFACEQDNSRTVDLDGTSSIYIYGGQAEERARASSLITTGISAVTRNADLLTTGSTDHSDLTGSAWAEANTNWETAPSVGYVVSRSSAGQIIYSTTGAADDIMRTNDGTATSVSPAGVDMYKSMQAVAGTWGGGEMVAFSPGDLAPDATPAAYDGTMGSGDYGIGCIAAGNAWDGHIRMVATWKRKLTTAQIQAYSP